LLTRPRWPATAAERQRGLACRCQSPVHERLHRRRQQERQSAEANKHCACGADVLEKKFTTQEIAQLMDKNTPPSGELGQRALKEISVCRVRNKR
jgi:hypothetical protein